MTKQEFNPNEIGEKIIDVIKTIYDPEIPVDIYELGLIYDVLVNENFDVKILMTLKHRILILAHNYQQEFQDHI